MPPMNPKMKPLSHLTGAALTHRQGSITQRAVIDQKIRSAYSLPIVMAPEGIADGMVHQYYSRSPTRFCVYAKALRGLAYALGWCVRIKLRMWSDTKRIPGKGIWPVTLGSDRCGPRPGWGNMLRRVLMDTDIPMVCPREPHSLQCDAMQQRSYQP